MANLKRKQIYLDEESDRALKRLALATKISEAEHIRRAVKKYIAKQKAKRREADPLRKLIGLCDKPDGPTNASIHHDRYLYGKQVNLGAPPQLE
ncbi:MAG: CopG family transcriptional regulator [Deltaproteobacteria bacterium]|nr:CopG family transcriptional regulator [Deltaproteobacteria bacterium]MBW2329384.1 CopG family transcriptional regulator [Deltaproteobacteria bacterium]